MKGAKLPVFVVLPMIVVLLVGACQAVGSPPTATPELPERVLFLGDSFTYWNQGVDYHIVEFAASANPPVTVEASSVTFGGFDLEDLWVMASPVRAIQEGTWDVVVLQEDVFMLDYDEQIFYEYTRKFDEEIKTIDAQTVMYMPWEYKEHRRITTEEIARVYSTIGAELGVKVAPVGLAWERSIQERPDLNLYGADGSHPSIRGTYLTVCVLYTTIFGQSPVGLTYQPAENSYRWNQLPMTEDEVAFLQGIAWETVVDYQPQ